jgi:hypothetical protein
MPKLQAVMIEDQLTGTPARASNPKQQAEDVKMVRQKLRSTDNHSRRLLVTCDYKTTRRQQLFELVTSASAFEELDRTLMLFSGLPGVECAKILAFACFCIYLARVETVFT